MSTDSFSVDNLPEIPFEYGMVFKDGLFTRLYTPQLTYWNDRLRSISERNVAAYAREDEAFNVDDRSFVAVFYDGETFNLLPMDEDDDPFSPYCLELYEQDPQLVKDMVTVAREVKRLKDERYEAQRFLAGLAMFDPNPVDLHRILGDGLSQMCNNVLREHGWVIEEMRWEAHEPAALKTFVEEQKDIVTAMQERVLLNMITI